MIGAMQSRNRNTFFKNDGRDQYRKREMTSDSFFEALIDITQGKRGRIPSQMVITRRLKKLGYTLSRSSVRQYMRNLTQTDDPNVQPKILRDEDGDLYIPKSYWKLVDDDSIEDEDSAV